jgi:formylglycine-generating enzyme required for sulfatase activity
MSDIDCLGVTNGHPPHEDCAKPVSELRVMRGGSFVNRAGVLANDTRSNSIPWMRDPTIGFRCVRDFE